MRVAVTCLLLGHCISGCAGLAAQSIPAVLVDPSAAATRTAVESAVHEALGRSDVRLAGDVFAASSHLIVEPRLEGRDLRRPEHLQLLQQGNICLVRHENGRTAPLAAQCKPE